MYTSRRARTAEEEAAYQRPGAFAPETPEEAETADEPEADAGREEPASWDEGTEWEDTPWESEGEYNERIHAEERDSHQVIATNRTIRLSAALAAMSGVFGLFLCWAEKESKAIRRVSVQSACLLIVEAVAGLVLLLLGVLLGPLPYAGFVIQILCWLLFIACALVVLVIRVRMMYFAWQGVAFRLPLLGSWLDERFH